MGFGDLVPGQNPKDPNSKYKLLLICFYSLFGMAVLAMCFSVMQSAAKRHILSLIKKIKNALVYLFDSSSRRKKKDEPISMVDIKREREELLQNIKLLKEYQSQMRKRRKKHVLH